MDGTFSNWKNEEMMASKYRQSKSNWKDKTLCNTKTQWKDRSDSRLDPCDKNQVRVNPHNPKALSNNTRSNWRDTYTRSKDRQVKRDSQEKVRRSSINKENNNNVKALTTAEELLTLDKFFGMSFKAISIEQQGGLEGSEPPKYLDPDLEQYMEEEFEINEADEDIYSESNTLTNFNPNTVMSYRNYKICKDKSIEAQFKCSFVDDNPSINNDTVIMNVEEKIKRKIIEKYSKNPRQKISVTTKLEQVQGKFLDLNKTEFIDKNQKKAGANPAKSHHNITQGEIQSAHKKNQANSQSPGKQSGDLNPKAAGETSKQGLRGSLTNFYQKHGKTNHGFVQQQDDGKSMENHIAFRNSFYAQNTQKQTLESDTPLITQNTLGLMNIFKNSYHKNMTKEEARQIQQQKSITKIDDYVQKQSGPPDLTKYTDMPINKPKQYNQKEKINEIKAKEQDKYIKYASRFNIAKSDLRDRSHEQVNQRMQTPTLYFQSDFKKPFD